MTKHEELEAGADRLDGDALMHGGMQVGGEPERHSSRRRAKEAADDRTSHRIAKGWTVYANPDGRFVLRRPHEDHGLRTTQTLRDGGVPAQSWTHAIRLAEAEYRQYLLHLERVGAGVAPAARRTTVRAMLPRYKKHLEKRRKADFLKEGRRDALCEGLTLWAEACEQSRVADVRTVLDFDLAAVNLPVVELWIAACKSAVHEDQRKGFKPRPYSTAQVMKIVEALDAFLAYAATITGVPSPVRAAGLVGQAREEHREDVQKRRGDVPLHWEIDDAAAIYENLLGLRVDGPDAEDILILLILLTGGLRYSEAATLTWGQLDFAQQILTIRTKKRVKKKNGGMRGSAPAKRQVPIMPLAVWHRLALYRDTKRSAEPSQRVFPRASARARREGDSVRGNYDFLDRVFVAACGRERPIGRGYHAPRHSVISILPFVCRAVPDLETGRMVPSTPYTLSDIQRMVGHSVGSATTVQVYSHLFEGVVAPFGTITTVDWSAIRTAYRQALMVRAAAVAAQSQTPTASPPPLSGSPAMATKLERLQRGEAA